MKKLIGLILLGCASCAMTSQEKLAKSLSIPLASLTPTTDALELEATDTLQTTRGSFPLHIVPLKNLPLNEPLTLVTIDPFHWTQTSHFQFLITEDGSWQIDGNTLDEAPIILKNLLKSQPLYVAVLSSQTQVLIPVILDPFKASLDHAEFSLITTHRKGTHFRLEGRSLIPGEKLIITESSGPILRRHVVRADALGNLSLKIEPIVLGRLGGFASLTIQKGPLETQMTFPWGGKLEQASPRFQPLALTTKPQAIDLATLAPKIEANLHL